MKIISKITNTLVLVLVIFLGFLAYGSINNRFYKVVTIQGNSMAPTFEYGDMIVVTRPAGDLALGTVVTMQVGSDVVTHRIVGFKEDGSPITKGDANDVADSYSADKVRIAGIYRLRIPKIGYLVLYLNSLRGNANPPIL